MCRDILFCLLTLAFFLQGKLAIGQNENENLNMNVPVLSYHNITTIVGKNKAYSITPAAFESQIRSLKDNGFVTILPEDLYEHLTCNKPLPARPVIISFDDSRKEHRIKVAPVLEKYGFKATFFIMTVTINKKNYMTADDIRSLSQHGHTIGHHTWDHPDLRKLPADGWAIQIDKAKTILEKIIGKPVHFFAYPFGSWNNNVIEQIKKRNFLLAFQLSGRQSTKYPLFTVRRLLVSGNWSGDQLCKEINKFY